MMNSSNYFQLPITRFEKSETSQVSKPKHERKFKELTEIYNNYESPETLELNIDTGNQDLNDYIELVITTLQERGIIPAR